MKRRIICLLAALCLTLSGCGWMDGNYSSEKLHEDHSQGGGSTDISAANYQELCAALGDMIASGKEKGIIYVGEYDQSAVEASIAAAVRNALTMTPLGAYAVESIDYELGSNSGKPAVALEITYLHGRTEIRKIRKAADMEAAEQEILKTLTECDASLVLLIENYTPVDIPQLVEDFAEAYPQAVMEVPQVAVGEYPNSGNTRILELKFAYENSREDLRQMRSHVEAMFDAADLYVSSDDSDFVKFSQLFGFLMERFDYQVETSITPAYSLLRHGVGDSKAFAVVYAAMCRQAGLECRIVTGTKGGEPWYWNIVLDGENYFHVDLLRSSQLGGFREFTDKDMSGYVWDYSAYPECPVVYIPEPTTAPAEEPTEAPTEGTTEAPDAPHESTEPETPSEPTEGTEENFE